MYCRCILVLVYSQNACWLNSIKPLAAKFRHIFSIISFPSNHSSSFQPERTPRMCNDVLDRQLQNLRKWMFTLFPTDRTAQTLSHLHRETLKCGLTEVHQRIIDLADLDLKLYHKYISLLSQREYEAMASDFIGWCWVSYNSVVDDVRRGDLEKLLWQDVLLHDKIASSVRKWKMKIDEKIVKR